MRVEDTLFTFSPIITLIDYFHLRNSINSLIAFTFPLTENTVENRFPDNS